MIKLIAQQSMVACILLQRRGLNEEDTDMEMESDSEVMRLASIPDSTDQVCACWVVGIILRVSLFGIQVFICSELGICLFRTKGQFGASYWHAGERGLIDYVN